MGYRINHIHLKSPDPRDRILVLQIISSHELALQYRRDLQRLADDPTEPIRTLTRALLETVASRPAPAGRAPGAPRQATESATSQAAAREELDTLLAQLAPVQPTSSDPLTLGRIRQLLRRVREPATEDATAVTQEAAT